MAAFAAFVIREKELKQEVFQLEIRGKLCSTYSL